jgi:DNA polymerase-3 subunit alpha (Gram-positive type)
MNDREDIIVTGIPTGFSDIDKLTQGLQKKDLIVVAGRPLMGKTAFALSLANYMAVKHDNYVVFFSLEMSKEQIVTHILSIESGIDREKLMNGNMKDEEWEDFVRSAGVISQSHLIIDDTPGIEISDLCTKCRELALENKLDIIMIDYLQLIRCDKERRALPRIQQIPEITRTLKALACELDVPIVVLSQLSHAVDNRYDNHPMLSDLHYIGIFEQDIDAAMLLYRDELYHVDTENRCIVEVSIAKNRNGKRGTVDLAFIPDRFKLANLEHWHGRCYGKDNMNRRVELRTHTKMSQMNSIADVRKLVRHAKEMGLSGIAITDINSAQAFPAAYDEYNEIKREWGANDRFKLIFGCEMNMTNLDTLNDHTKTDPSNAKGIKTNKVILLAKNNTGRENLYRLITASYKDYYDDIPRITRSMIEKYRDGLIVGCCESHGEVFWDADPWNSDEEIKKSLSFYDFVEIEPIKNYIDKQYAQPGYGPEKIEKTIIKINDLCKQTGVPLVASSNVCYVEPEDKEAYKALLAVTDNRVAHFLNADHHLMLDDELIDEFMFLGAETAEKIVIENPYKIAEMIEVFEPIPDVDRKCPSYPDTARKLKKICFKKAHEIYGDKLPAKVKERLNEELAGLSIVPYDSLYMIAHDIAKKSKEAGFTVGARGCAGASFVSYLIGISTTNPLPAHYICRKCKTSVFKVASSTGYHSGFVGADLPDKLCPLCGIKMSKDGYDIPAETFTGWHYSKEPSFDINIAPEYLQKARLSLADIEGIGGVFHAGTNSTVSRNEAEKIAKAYYKMTGKKVEKNAVIRMVTNIAGVKKADASHPVGMILLPKGVDINTYSPVIRCAEDDILSTQLDWHDIDAFLYKVNLIPHSYPSFVKYLEDETGVKKDDIPLDDEKVMSLFAGTDILGVDPEKIGGITIGTLGVSEFGCKEVRDIIGGAHPRSFGDLIKISALLHGTGAWHDNAETLIKNGVADLDDCIACRDDIMHYLIDKGIARDIAFHIMEFVRRGKASSYWGCELKPEWIEQMKTHGVPDWYIESIKKIQYLFPKAHCAYYTLALWQMLYYKFYYPEAFYRGWLKYVAVAVNATMACKEYDKILGMYEELSKRNYNRLGEKSKMMLDELPVVMEMFEREVT